MFVDEEAEVKEWDRPVDVTRRTVIKVLLSWLPVKFGSKLVKD